MQGNSRWCSIVAVGLALLLVSSFVGCGRYQEGDKAGLAQSRKETVPASQTETTLPPSTTPTPDTTQKTTPTDDSEVHFEQGNIYLERDEWDKAIAEYSKAIEVNPQFAKAYANRAVAYLEKLEYMDVLAEGNQYNFVIADCEKAIKLDPLLKLNIVLARAYVRWGDYYMEHPEPAFIKPPTAYNRAIEIDPTNANYYVSRASLYVGVASYSLAIADYTKAIELKPEVANFYYLRGRCYADNGGYVEAIADYSRAIELGELGDLIVSVYLGRANAHENLGNHGEALTDCRKALELSEDASQKEQILKAIEELESKQVIKDLAYIMSSVTNYTDDADPEPEGILVYIYLYDSKSNRITFEGIPLIVTIHLYDLEKYFYYQNTVKVYYSSVIYGVEERIAFKDIMWPTTASWTTRVSRVRVQVNVTTPNQMDFSDTEEWFLELPPKSLLK